jgi:hypothetical protein
MQINATAGQEAAQPPPVSTSPALRAVMDLETYRQERAAHLMRTPEALKWFIRQHGTELIKDGAMLKIGGRWTAHADRFDEAILRIGQRLAGSPS